jgi:hypothetical protein
MGNLGPLLIYESSLEQLQRETDMTIPLTSSRNCRKKYVEILDSRKFFQTAFDA